MKNASVTPDTVSDDELGRLRGLVPLHSLPDEAFDELAESATFETLRPGDMLFEQGDTDHQHVYLLDGKVSLLVDLNEQDRVEAGSGTARFPLAHQLPRKQSVRALGQVRVARIDSRLLSDLLARAQTVDYQVNDLAEASEDDWMSQLLQSRVLQQVPAANIQRVMMSVEQVDVYRGDHLITQGDTGDYYYMLTRGRAVVRRDNGDGKGPVELATLGPGDAFGEEALLSDNPRNSSVTMLQDGHVLRLSKQNFLDLIQNPLLETVTMEAARTRVEQGSVWLDLRSREQYDESHLPGAINFPFESLRYQTSSLDPDGHYVLYSNSGRRAMAGAFLLTERGFDVAVLEDGLDAYARDGDADDVVAQSDDVSGDDVAVRQQIAEAEQRARELEQKLKEAETLKREQENERHQQMQQVSAAVDMARRKLLESEAQKQEAESAKQEAYAEMERLTGSLEEVQSERTSLRERMAEIEGLDKQLQARLEKAEREIIGERDRAESAASSLEDLSQRLSDVLEQRELERDQHARERGELIEDVTGLQMDLEQAQLDLEELKGRFDEDRAAWAGREEEGKATAQRLLEMESANRALQAERDALLGEQEGMQATQRAEQGKAEETRQLLAGELEQAQVLADTLGERVAQAETALRERDDELARLHEQLTALEHAQVQLRDTTETELGAMRAAGEQVLAETRQALDEATGERDRLLGEQAALQARFDEERASAADGSEQQAARVTELEGQLERLRAEAGDAEAGLRRASDELRSTLESEQQHHAQDTAELAALQQAHAALQQDRDALQAQLASGDADARAAIEQGQQRISELEQALAGQREASATAEADSQQAMQQLRAELEQAESRA
ncbi:MAG: cyclic nucleotide-binding domain-containing protein, partial [Gammaproteobacteria bacterium]|nr:cyclic nucleotide-binding domain-containing protein [Gammaproteobacteria bacterium]